MKQTEVGSEWILEHDEKIKLEVTNIEKNRVFFRYLCLIQDQGWKETNQGSAPLDYWNYQVESGTMLKHEVKL
jgi:hypothetical protein